MISFEESGMTFQVEKDSLFRIEKSGFYNRLKSHGVSTVECIILKKGKIILIEAKRSIPRTDEGSRETFWSEILKKDVHSIMMLSSAIWSGNTTEIGKNVINALSNKPRITFLLIMNAEVFNSELCNELSEMYRKELKSIAKIYNADVLVINATDALKKGIIKNIKNLERNTIE